MKNKIKYLWLLFLIITCQSEAQTVLPVGYPDRNPEMDVLPGFINPPKGYGEVPFYWWQGDTLTSERILWQLDQLKNKGISSLQINYSHKDSGGLSYGLSNPSKPALFTEAWWSLFKWFASEAKKRGMTVSLSDYTLGIGQGFSMDEAIKENPDLNGSLLRSYSKTLSGLVNLEIGKNFLTLTAVKLDSESAGITATRKDLLPFFSEGRLNYDFGNETWRLTGVYSDRIVPSYDPMNPHSGQAYNSHFFEKFENALPDKGSGMLNFFFSDELNFRLSGNLWNSRFADEFFKRKGYNIVPYLDALFTDIGNITPKIRLDYNDVIVSLSEENFFKPVYQWHQERGMIFGCDHGGRGRDVAEFGDYFRTQRWNQGPGSDQPNLSKDIIKAKVAASISHLYNRPRVWLEGFHSSGWGTSSADVTDAILANFVAGYNLLSFHGLYYSTMGGWWEWAPPDNHFRMPYWNQIDPLMNCVNRLSYLLSQGYHSCDIALIYPTEPVIADMDGKKSVSLAFETGEQLYSKGIDFDFIDYESLARAEIKNKELSVSGELYKVIIIPSMKAIRYSSLKKIEEFKKAGGLVVNLGETPKATEKNGSNDPGILSLTQNIFSPGENFIQCNDPKQVPSLIIGKYEEGFRLLTDLKDRRYVMHRRIGKREVYALYNFPSGSKCFFRAKGIVQIWNPWNGETALLSGYIKDTTGGTEVTLPLSEKDIQILVFGTEDAHIQKTFIKNEQIRQLPLGDDWEFELKPSLDNQWGDFQLPASRELMGAQVRQLYFTEAKDYKGGVMSIDNSWKRVTCGFGSRFMKMGPLPEIPSNEELIKTIPAELYEDVTIAGKKYSWEEYSFSWQKGVEEDYGHQGYHGLKGEMYDNFIRLGAMKDVKMSKTRSPEAAGRYYILFTNIIAPSDGQYDMLSGEVKPFKLFVNNLCIDPGSTTIVLKKGSNTLLLVYDKACETFLVVRKPGDLVPGKKLLAMRWYNDYGLLPFDCSLNNKISTGLFAFKSAPALRSLSFSAYGKVSCWADGIKIKADAGKVQKDGLISYFIALKSPKSESSQIVIKIEYLDGYRGAGAIPQYINQECGKGTISLGDWSVIDGLRSYSGGAWYRKTINIESIDSGLRMEIDLGDLVSSAELLINGRSAGVKVSPPWKFDITESVHQGNNRVEVLIYNTLANNYTSIPTRYRGSIKSGLIGPVSLKVMKPLL